jgi:hypothetical protein
MTVHSRHVEGRKSSYLSPFPVGEWTVDTPRESVEPFFELDSELIDIARYGGEEMGVKAKSLSYQNRVVTGFFCVDCNTS